MTVSDEDLIQRFMRDFKLLWSPHVKKKNLFIKRSEKLAVDQIHLDHVRNT